VHIYKCGGHSLRQYIRDNLVTPLTTVIDQWAYSWESNVQPYDRLLGNVTRSEYLRYTVPKELGEIVVLTHSFFYEFMKSWTGFSFATMLRDPVKRAISQHDFQKRTFERFKDSDLNSWIGSMPTFEFNLQTAALCGAPALEIDRSHLERAKANLHYFDFFGFVDQYENALQLFNRVYEIDYDGPPPKINATPEPKEVPQSTLDLIRDRSRFDYELLEYARRIYKTKIAALEMIVAGTQESMPPSLRNDSNID
jgi:hypothetical protein